MKSGFIGIIGRPNVGKSTLMNAMLGEKIAITSAKPQTTLNRITGIYTDLEYEGGEGLQMIFLDTPGIHKPHNKLGSAINETAVNTLSGVDVILLIVDGTSDFGRGDESILRLVSETDAPRILAINKMDLMSPEQYLELYNKYNETGLFEDIYGVSALKGDNVTEIRDRLAGYMSEGPMYYPEDIATDDPVRFIVSEIIREKLMNYLEEEVPHGVFVEIETFKEPEVPGRATEIGAVIYCEKKSHKGIIIGKGGAKLKGVGKAARLEIEELLGCKVFLSLFVKVKEGWRDSERTIRRWGYKDE
ncbi:MAG: GTPase Era [Clostridiales bacterium]|jgi:GTP-binding protein Era|nr:GTPase Era [Clostridiales bacterium]